MNIMGKIGKIDKNFVNEVSDTLWRKASVYYPLTSTALPLPIQKYGETVTVEPGDTLSILISGESDSVQRDVALMALSFKDKAGKSLGSIPELETSESVGPYFYLQTKENEIAVTRRSIKVPEDAVSLVVKGVRWDRAVGTDLHGVAVHSKLRQRFLLGRGIYSSLVLSSDVDFSLTIGEGREFATIRIDYVPGDIKSEAPVAIGFKDIHGKAVPTMGDHPIHPKYGPIITLPGSANTMASKTWELQIPQNASVLELHGIDWGAKNAVVMDIQRVASSEGGTDAFTRFLDIVESNVDPLFIIDTTAPPLGHKTLSLRPNNLTDSYTNLGINVLFFPFSSIQDQPALIRQNALQLNRVDYWKAIRGLANLEGERRKVYVCSSFPNAEAVAAAEYLKLKGWTIVYECRDDMEEFNRVGYSKWYRPSLERKMVSIADVVVSVSAGLDEKLNSLVPRLKKSHVVPNGVNRGVIEDGAPFRTLDQSELRNQSNVLGYVGHLTPSWFDWDLLRVVALDTPEVKYEIVGHGAPENLDLPDNVVLLGPKSHKELLDIVGAWKAGLIPFKNVPLTRSVDPNKIYEYFAWGLRCISAPMGKVEEYPSTWVYRDSNEMVAAVNQVLADPYTEDEISGLVEFLDTCTWDCRAQEMLDLIFDQGNANE